MTQTFSPERSETLRFVRLFEPLVIASMNLFMATRCAECFDTLPPKPPWAMTEGWLGAWGWGSSSIPLQQQIIFLVCRLVLLKVNYGGLDDRLVSRGTLFCFTCVAVEVFLLRVLGAGVWPRHCEPCREHGGR
jgi:hypothetical protein